MLEHELRNALDLQSGGQTCNSDAHVPEYSRSGQGHSVAMAIKDPNCVNALPVLKMDALTGGKLLCCLHDSSVSSSSSCSGGGGCAVRDRADPEGAFRWRSISNSAGSKRRSGWPRKPYRALCTDIAETKNASTCEHAGGSDVARRPIAQHTGHATFRGTVSIPALGTAVDVSQYKTGIRDGRIVNDRQEPSWIGH